MAFTTWTGISNGFSSENALMRSNVENHGRVISLCGCCANNDSDHHAYWYVKENYC